MSAEREVRAPGVTSQDQHGSSLEDRERQAEEHERQLDAWARRLEERLRDIDAVVRRLERQSQALVERSQALLAEGHHSVTQRAAKQPGDWQAPEPRRAEAAAEGGTTSETAPPAGTVLAGADSPIDRALTLRQQFIATAAALAATEEEAARVQDSLAAAHPGRAAQYLRNAEEARTRASVLRDAARSFDR